MKDLRATSRLFGEGVQLSGRSAAGLVPLLALSGALLACVGNLDDVAGGSPRCQSAAGDSSAGGCQGALKAAGRDSWVVAEIEAWNAELSDGDRDEKYCAMAESSLRFYRGSNHLFWYDHAGDARLAQFGSERTRIWLQADLHAQNYGSFDDDDGEVVYGLNDFDESIIADYQWDVWRMATSLVIMAQASGDFSESQQRDLIDAFSESYLDTMASYRGNDGETERRFDRHNTYGLLDDFLDEVERTGSREEMLDDWTSSASGERVFELALDELGPADAAVAAAIQDQMPSYVSRTAGDLSVTPGYFEVKDIARRLHAGTGSLGTPRYYVLIEGASGGDDDDRILDVKRQGPPTPFAFLSPAERAVTDAVTTNSAERAVIAYRALVAGADDHLGWMTLSDGTYSVRERSPFKGSFPIEALNTENRFENLAEQWGAILATAHARADKDARAEHIPYSLDREVDIMTDGSHSEFRALVRAVAFEYATQVALDYQAFGDYLTASGLACPSSLLAI